MESKCWKSFLIGFAVGSGVVALVHHTNQKETRTKQVSDKETVVENYLDWIPVFNFIANSLKSSESISIDKFGVFYVTERHEYTRTNKSGNTTKIKAKRYARFKPSKDLVLNYK